MNILGYMNGLPESNKDLWFIISKHHLNSISPLNTPKVKRVGTVIYFIQPNKLDPKDANNLKFYKTRVSDNEHILKIQMHA